MSAWLIGIVGVVSLGVLIEIILPEGENSKYIRGIFSIIVIFVIVSPLPKLLKGDFIKEFTGNGETSQIEIDEEYYQAVKEQIHSTLINGLTEELTANGYAGVEFEITFDDDYAYAVKKVTVKSVITSDKDWEEIKAIIKNYVGATTIERS
ncbi:MAG: stage III sporulation protein AF [Clostridia bacterium]|nr:stage III sporulation protein AF [Clostridia bacterium]MDE7328674.1 stage III sporulation protein AF [Clostridia bacterium]